MKKEELERLKKGQQLFEQVDLYKEMIHSAEEMINDKELFEKGRLFSVSQNGKIEEWVTLTPEAIPVAAEAVLTFYKKQLAEIEKQIEEL